MLSQVNDRKNSKNMYYDQFYQPLSSGASYQKLGWKMWNSTFTVPMTADNCNLQKKSILWPNKGPRSSFGEASENWIPSSSVKSRYLNYLNIILLKGILIKFSLPATFRGPNTGYKTLIRNHFFTIFFSPIKVSAH